MASVELDSSLVILAILLGIFPWLLMVISRRSLIRSGSKKDDDGGRRRPVPPSPPALPIIGNLHQLGRGNHHRKLRALARRHGSLFLLRLGAVPTLVVSSAAMAEEVLRAQDLAFCGRPQKHTPRRVSYDYRDLAFSSYGERWRQLRRVAVVNFLSARRVDSFRALRAEEVSSLVARVRDRSRRPVRGDDGINVSELITSLTYAVVSRSALGNKLGGMDPGTLRGMLKDVTVLLETTAVSDLFPKLRWVDRATGLDWRIERTARKLDDIFERVLGGAEPGDMLHDLLSVVDNEGGEGSKLDRTDVKALILDLFIAGIDTTSKSIEWAMAELVKNPNELDKVQAEVRRVSAAHGGVQEEQLGMMTRLQAAMKEAMRLHPPVPLLIPHEVIQDTELQGYHIPSKTRVLINAWAIGRDAEYWEKPEEFLPERFMHNTTFDYNGKDFRFIPFGAGRRGCPGIAFATRLAELTLANLLYHFRWELPEGQDVESFEVVESNGLSPGLKSALTLVPKPLQP